MNTYKKSRRLSCTMCRRAFRTARALKTHSCSKGGGGVLAASPQFREVKKPSRERGAGKRQRVERTGGRSGRHIRSIRELDAIVRKYGFDPNAARRAGAISTAEYDYMFEYEMG